jgi:ferredoxin
MQAGDRSYRQLAARFDDPDAIPALPEILACMLTPTEAAVLLELPASAAQIAQRADLPGPQVQACLDKAYRQGLALRVPLPAGGVEYALPDLYVDSILGDRRNNDLGARFQELWRQWTVQQRARRSFVIDEGTKPTCRILPAGQMVEDHNTILPPVDARRIVEASRCRVIQQCPCRFRNPPCPYPVDDICLLFDHLAEEAIERGYGREASRQEVLEVLERAAALGLVHVSSSEFFADASHGTEFICNCCPCCCELLEPYFASDRKLPLVIHYFAQVDEDACSRCGLCAERCHFDALRLADGLAVVDQASCVGCGLCAVVCADGAIALETVPGHRYEPAPAHRHLINPRK